MKFRTCSFFFLFVLMATASHADAGKSCRGLLEAVAAADVGRLKTILAGGCDPNTKDARGGSVSRWLGSGQRISDDALLQAAKLLDQYHCDFDGGLIVNLAPRRLPKTLAFLASKKIAADLDLALKSVVRGDDLETIQVLLDAGADPLAGVALSSALSDAAWAGRTASVSAMLKAVKDKAAPKGMTAYEGALRKGFAETAQAFVDGGVRPPPVVVPTSSPCEAKELTAEQRRLLARLSLPNANGLAGLAGNMSCKLIQECHDLVLIDCNSAADGPAYYIDQKTPKILATCGGACMRGCTGCPPKQWDCSCLR